ncbi:MAG: thioredoxin domain-containing protein, partial [Crocinitomicaceae bacterium]|nr:thioredoxin domain-containing protein [Crocinitomicaceae bacterium]
MNHLSKETSPYLLQHAGNPVHWFAWSDEAWQLARTENKLVLVSIGYSACHWCHVMEHEVFENEGAAKIMNDHFVSIKVDREERPDVDQVYMAAVQLMTQSGGWPLNCFCLPDGRPVFGGTYFPLNQWKKVLNSLIELQSEQPLKLEDYAEMLRKGIESADIISSYPGSQKADRSIADDLVKHWKNYWDTEKGGTKRAPKFPMPNNLQFLIHYSSLTGNREVAEFVHLTLRKMALGGIYDKVGGGFARYSVDDEWKVPHFEKMLYDNAQLVSLYCDAFRSSGDPLYRRVVEETLLFAEREMRSANRLFFSALDADSDGIEGKFYTWTAKEINQIAGKEEDWVRSYFSITEKGNWESGRNILHCSQT